MFGTRGLSILSSAIKAFTSGVVIGTACCLPVLARPLASSIIPWEGQFRSRLSGKGPSGIAPFPPHRNGASQPRRRVFNQCRIFFAVSDEECAIAAFLESYFKRQNMHDALAMMQDPKTEIEDLRAVIDGYRGLYQSERQRKAGC